jgi:hypothetical protein
MSVWSEVGLEGSIPAETRIFRYRTVRRPVAQSFLPHPLERAKLRERSDTHPAFPTKEPPGRTGLAWGNLQFNNLASGCQECKGVTVHCVDPCSEDVRPGGYLQGACATWFDSTRPPFIQVENVRPQSILPPPRRPMHPDGGHVGHCHPSSRIDSERTSYAAP